MPEKKLEIADVLMTIQTPNDKCFDADDSMDLTKCLSIFIITYNRATQLQETLVRLKQSSWACCSVTVLDNCSTDDTAKIVRAAQQDFPTLTYVSNAANVGSSANAIQAFLISKTPYTWVLCDDDYFDFTNVDDVETELRAQKAKLILVGGHPEPKRFGAGQLATPQDLMLAGVNYYRDTSFLPSTIYATDFARRQLSACYGFCHFNYSQVALALAAVKEALPVYVSRQRLVTPSIGTQSYTSREQLIWWYGLAATVSDQTERKRLLTSQWQGPLDSTGLYGVLNTALRLRLYNIALRLLLIFKLQVVKSIVRMVYLRVQGVRYVK